MEDGGREVVVERGCDFQAAAAPAPSPLNQVFAIEFTKAPDAAAVRVRLITAAMWTAIFRPRWYAPGGSLPGLRSEPASQLRRLFPCLESSPRCSAHDGPLIPIASLRFVKPLSAPICSQWRLAVTC